MKTAFYLTLIILLTGCKILSDGPIRYQVICTPPGCTIVYQNNSGGTMSETIYNDFWEFEFDGRKGTEVFVSAQALKTDANIEIKIFFWDKTELEGHASGDYAIAIVQGKVN